MILSSFLTPIILILILILLHSPSLPTVTSIPVSLTSRHVSLLHSPVTAAIIPIMEIAQVKTTPRTALPMEPSETSPKRRKINTNTNTNTVTASFLQLKTLTNHTTSTSTTEERFSGESPASCCSSNGSFHENRIIKFSDLEVESAQVETSTCNCGEQQQMRREMSLCSSELRVTNSQEVDSAEKKATMQTKTKSRSALSTPPQKMPTESELQEFFAAAEEDIQKRFSDKYNYDIVKDVPLEGRYEWVKLKP